MTLFSRSLLAALTVASFTVASCNKTKSNTAATQTISGAISANTTWNHSDGLTEDYIVDGTVYVDAGLTISPGTIIHFKTGAALEIRNPGFLNAVGTADKRITFDGIDGTYQGFVFYSTSTQNRLQFCNIKGGGAGSIIFQQATVMIGENVTADGAVSIRDCVFEGGKGNGIYLVDNSSLNDFHNNSFTNMNGFPLSISAENINQVNADNTYSLNGKNYVEVRDCFTPKGSGQSWQNLTIPYYLNSTINLFGAHTVQSGTTVVLGINGIIHPAVSGSMSGSFSAIGTSASMISFKGETNTPGAWNSIFFSTTTSKNVLQYCHLSYGGGPNNLYGQNGMIALDENSGGSVSIRDCVIDNSGGYGINLGGNTGFNADILTANSFAANLTGNIKY